MTNDLVISAVAAMSSAPEVIAIVMIAIIAITEYARGMLHIPVGRAEWIDRGVVFILAALAIGCDLASRPDPQQHGHDLLIAAVAIWITCKVIVVVDLVRASRGSPGGVDVNRTAPRSNPGVQHGDDK